MRRCVNARATNGLRGTWYIATPALRDVRRAENASHRFRRSRAPSRRDTQSGKEGATPRNAGVRAVAQKQGRPPARHSAAASVGDARAREKVVAQTHLRLRRVVGQCRKSCTTLDGQCCTISAGRALVGQGTIARSHSKCSTMIGQSGDRGRVLTAARPAERRRRLHRDRNWRTACRRRRPDSRRRSATTRRSLDRLDMRTTSL